MPQSVHGMDVWCRFHEDPGIWIWLKFCDSHIDGHTDGLTKSSVELLPKLKLSNLRIIQGTNHHKDNELQIWNNRAD